MRCLAVILLVVAPCAAGCVSVDLGQASKDWSEVGKSFADSYKSDVEAVDQPQQQAPAE